MEVDAAWHDTRCAISHVRSDQMIVETVVLCATRETFRSYSHEQTWVVRNHTLLNESELATRAIDLHAFNSRIEQCDSFSHRDAITPLTSTRAAAQPLRQPNHGGSARGAGSLRCCYAPVRLSRTIATAQGAGQAASELLGPAAHRTWLTPIGCSSSTCRQTTPLRGGAAIRRGGDGDRSGGDDSDGVRDLFRLHRRLPRLLLCHWGCHQAFLLMLVARLCAVVLRWLCRLCSAATGRTCRGMAAYSGGHSSRWRLRGMLGRAGMVCHMKVCHE